MVAITDCYKITWEKLPDDYVLPDDPGDNINQPYLAAALTESLEGADTLSPNALTVSNYGIYVTLNGKIVIKAPDWAYIPAIRVSRDEVIRNYTPQLQGDIPAIVMEFISQTEGTEYSVKPTYPSGRWFFYERVLKVPYYVIFDPGNSNLEVYRLNESEGYQLESPNEEGRYWIPSMNLFLGVWEGTRENRTGSWLRWWNEGGESLLWGWELAQQERQRAEIERERAERLAARLRAAGIEPEEG
jgi:Uma2 family endonuclease